MAGPGEMIQQQLLWVTPALQTPAEHLASNHPSPITRHLAAVQHCWGHHEALEEFCPQTAGQQPATLSCVLASWLWQAGWQRLCLQWPMLLPDGR